METGIGMAEIERIVNAIDERLFKESRGNINIDDISKDRSLLLKKDLGVGRVLGNEEYPDLVRELEVDTKITIPKDRFPSPNKLPETRRGDLIDLFLSVADEAAKAEAVAAALA